MVKEKAKATITALLCSGTIGIVMAYNGMAFWGLAVQQITYIFIANALLWYFSPWRPTFSFNFKPIREMLPFSSKLLITNVFHYINDNIFSVLLGRFYTSQDVGYYTQANKWTNMGFSLISNMINGDLSLSWSKPLPTPCDRKIYFGRCCASPPLSLSRPCSDWH